uniref:Uncharacterized protein n=1 Tax=Arundo donax TaxID=35708 RepID=A0A0A9GL53_ARUDO
MTAFGGKKKITIEKFGHLYIVVCVIVGDPSAASLLLKNLRSGLRPTSSGLILSSMVQSR